MGAAYWNCLVLGISALSMPALHAQTSWELEAAKLYPAPDAVPIRGGRVLIAGPKIEAIATGSDRYAGAAKAPQCNGGVIVAGFQNSHVHFTSDAFLNAGNQPTAALNAALTRMLTQYGYTTVFDIASDRDNTLALRARIESGQIAGPRILTVGLPLFPPEGIPIYLSLFRKELLDKMPQPASVDQALQVVRENFAAGTDGTKLFVATPQREGVKRMPAEIARAAAEETHRRGRLVFAHPTDAAGLQAALDAGVDILAHPLLGVPAPWPEALMKRARDARVSIVPTLKLLPFELEKQRVPAQTAERIVNETVSEFGKFAAMGGDILFGTDIDYMTDYDPSLEYQLMAKAGMRPMQILASLTTAPAARWNEQGRRGRIAPGMDADLVVLDGDPTDSAENFAKVRCTVRGGTVIYSRKEQAEH